MQGVLAAAVVVEAALCVALALRLRAARLLGMDPLTGCLLRRVAEAAVKRVSGWSVVVVDLDGLKAVNDLWGHEAGDRLLARAGRVLRSAVRPGDAVSGWGGDDFVVLLRGCSLAGAEQVAGRLCLALEAGGVPASCGVAAACPGESLAAVVARADAAMYRRKRAVADGAPRWPELRGAVWG